MPSSFQNRANVPFVAPALPNATPEYSQIAANETSRALRIYFNQVDDQLRNTTFPELTVGTVCILAGAGDPRAGSGTAAPQGSIFLRTDGTGAPHVLYVKYGSGNTDWAGR